MHAGRFCLRGNRHRGARGSARLTSSRLGFDRLGDRKGRVSQRFEGKIAERSNRTRANADQGSAFECLTEPAPIVRLLDNKRLATSTTLAEI